MTTIEVRSQAQLDKALDTAKPYDIIAIHGDSRFAINRRPASGSASVTASGSASVTAYDSASVTASGSASVTASGSASVTAYGSASVTASGSASVTAYGSASVTAYGSASVTASGSASVTAYDSASVTAYDSASVTAYDSASVTASKYVSVHTHAGQGRPKITGGVLIEVPAIESMDAWCDLFGIEVVAGAVTVFKAVDDEYATNYSRRAGIFYTPGLGEVSAPDWKPEPQCGNGLHVAPSPHHALAYNEGATRFVSMRVLVSEVRTPQKDDDHGKVKTPRILGPIVEVDIHGRPVGKRSRKAAAA